MVSGASVGEFWPVFRGLVFVLYRPHRRLFLLLLLRFLRLALVSVVLRLRRFRFFTFVALALGLIAVSVVSHLIFRVRCWGFFCATVSCLCLVIRVLYIDRSFKLTIFRDARIDRAKCEFGVDFLPRLQSAHRFHGGESGRPGWPVGALATVDLRGRN